MTTPDSFAMQSYISKARKAGVKFLVIETTSHGLHQNRLFGIPFNIAVLTNISNEHLDYHKTYEKYVGAKAKLFQMAKTAILNRDDKSLSYIFPYLKKKKIIIQNWKSVRQFRSLSPRTTPHVTMRPIRVALAFNPPFDPTQPPCL